MLNHDDNRIVKSRKRRRKSRGQSIVEFAILLPLLIMMMSGLIEFGFMLNYYLDLVDAAREAARFAANDDPLLRDEVNYGDTDNSFYLLAQDMVQTSINVGSAGQISLDPGTDDIVISAFSILDNTVLFRYPAGSGDSGLPLNNNHVSEFTTADIDNMLVADLVDAPNTGMVLVEIFYDYNMILGLPWITAFVDDPITLHAYTIMPNINVEPTPTP